MIPKVLLALWLAGSGGVRTGIDLLAEEPYLSLVRDKRVGLITNQTGINHEFRPTAEVLRDLPGVRVTALFAPEHGFYGNEQAGKPVSSQSQIYSLYGENRSPQPQMLREVDVLVFDIQDVGSRFYTFISTMFECMEAASETGIPFIVLDRPVPIGGEAVQGPVLEPGFESFVGAFRLPIRHGMTPGELARMFRSENGLRVDLQIVPLRSWKRHMWFDQTGLPWVPPSPNMPTRETAAVYPGSCLIEGTNLSEGRGTTKPFELIGAPWLNGTELARRMNALSLPGVRFRPQVFNPAFSKYEGKTCSGLQVHVTDRNLFEPIRSVLYLLSSIRMLHPNRLHFNDSFDRLAGNSWVREKLEQGESPDKIIENWQEDLRAFKEARSKYLLYQ